MRCIVDKENKQLCYQTRLQLTIQSGFILSWVKMSDIPIIDFARVSESNEEISENVKWALANVGFLYIINHGVDMSKVTYIKEWKGFLHSN